MVGIHHFATIGELTIVGGMSGVRFDLPPYMMADGNPAEPRNINIIGCRRDGMPEDQIRLLRDIFKIIYHDREKNGTPIVEAIARAREVVTAHPDSPAARLVEWQQAHLEISVKGRIQEAHRPPVIGGAASPVQPAKPA